MKNPIVINGKKYLKPEEFLARFHPEVRPSMGTLANWRHDGKGPESVKMLGKVFYPLDSVLAWESDQLTGNSRAKPARKKPIKAAG